MLLKMHGTKIKKVSIMFTIGMFCMSPNAQNIHVPYCKYNYITAVQPLNYASLYSHAWHVTLSQQHRWKHKLGFLSCFYGENGL